MSKPATMLHGEQTLALAEVIHRFRQMRLDQGLTHEELAKRAGLSRSAVSHIENGKRKPSLLAALCIARALGVELYEMLEHIEHEKRSRDTYRS